MDLQAQDGSALVEVVENQRFWGVMWCVGVSAVRVAQPERVHIQFAAAMPFHSVDHMHIEHMVCHRGPPLLPNLDWPAWSDASGSGVPLLRPPVLDGQGGWFVVRTPSTDDEGWLYGSSFQRLVLARPGGRASKRVGDNVRSRVWRRLSADKVQPVARNATACCMHSTRGYCSLCGLMQFLMLVPVAIIRE
jgi:hypothetical protein